MISDKWRPMPSSVNVIAQATREVINRNKPKRKNEAKRNRWRSKYMKHVISGTNRPGSRTLQVAKFVQKLFAEVGEPIGLIDLAEVGLEHLGASAAYGDAVPPKMKTEIDKINAADGLIVVSPEYNGSMPGALKYFIDHWTYPDSYEFRPIALIGLGGRFGALRTVEHLQGVFGFRNAYIYPERVFITDVHKALDSAGALGDPKLLDLMRSQVQGFRAFTKALSAAGIDANGHIKAKASKKSV
jgi:chromate reductase